MLPCARDIYVVETLASTLLPPSFIWLGDTTLTLVQYPEQCHKLIWH